MKCKPRVAHAQVQEDVLVAAYSDRLLSQARCRVVMDDKEHYLWRGLRVRMGICQDVPQAIVPHCTSGRADYFGSAVNRSVLALKYAW